ncbi:hypothetical protein H257_06913 [Aphanomyces astaci]|uniref:Uncharacterized protein n=1 Tax=Aphanomyces astaci TaxID=112090 RepID=W4GIZ0_APHAT|nr:hypothetical protein H257_06913 [Aphanomyces astaci]ETV79660.1 hypothetical protein H257_06913 [Aphanomyces astaci]|eukprot:XP_009830596.1 hypothetical protein H257_06913 [Aphanomyces astaci]
MLPESMLVSGEAMWITYVFNDFLLLLSRNAEPSFPPLSAGLSWLVYVCWDMGAPTELYATLDRNCAIDYARMTIVCKRGAVQLGDVHRAVTLVLMHLSSIVMSFGGVWLWQCVNILSSSPAFSGHLLVSGTATAF